MPTGYNVYKYKILKKIKDGIMKTFIKCKKGYWDWDGLNLIPFYIEDVSGNGGELSIRNEWGEGIENIEYSLDNITWTSTKPSIPANGRVYVRANAIHWGAPGVPIWYSDQPYNVGGNVMSMYYGSGFTGNETSFPELRNNILSRTWAGDQNIRSAENLVLPANNVPREGYKEMFDGSSITKSPIILPAGRLGYQSYCNMFQNCTSLTTAPIIPASEIPTECCHQMFYNTGITTSPTLHAKSVGERGCYGMFRNCHSLVTAGDIKAEYVEGQSFGWMFAECENLITGPLQLLPTTTYGYSYEHMFWGCTSLVNIPSILPVTNWGYYCCEGMFEYCESITTAPELMGENVRDTGCFRYMFNGCRNLTSVKIHCYDTWGATDMWLNDVASVGTVIKPSTCRIDYNTPSGVPENWSVTNVDDIHTPFYIENPRGSNISLNIQTDRSDATNIQYSTDGINWSDEKPSILSYSRVYVRANATYWDNGTSASFKYPRINGSADYNAGGNMMSLLYGSDFTGNETSFPTGSVNTFKDFFGGVNSPNFAMLLKSAENLYLPATTLVDYCYSGMFSGCTGLTSAPELPATTLAEGCYSGMFIGCSSLTSAPELPATTMERECYSQMFRGCSSLTSAPELPATTMTYRCYYGMFQNSGLTSAPELPATTLAERCYEQMFQGCTGLTTAPDLMVDTLAENCYQLMFRSCSNLSSIKCAAVFRAAYNWQYVGSWVDGVSATGTFYKSANATWPTGTSGIPSGWTVVDI